MAQLDALLKFRLARCCLWGTPVLRVDARSVTLDGPAPAPDSVEPATGAVSASTVPATLAADWAVADRPVMLARTTVLTKIKIG